MRVLSQLLVIFSITFVFLAGCTKKTPGEQAVDKYYDYIKSGQYEPAYEMTSSDTKKFVGKEMFLDEAKKIESLKLYTKLKPAVVSPDGKNITIDTEFFGAKAAYNSLPELKITFHAVKNGEKWEIVLEERITEIQKEMKAAMEEIPVSPELIETGKKYKDLIEVKDVKNGEVEFSNGLTQYMMEATIKNNADVPFSYVGVLVKFMNDDESKVLFEKVFYLIYTRQIQAIYPIKPKEERDVIIPGYDAGDIEGEWTGKLQWEVYSAKIATEAELIELD